MTQTVKLQRRTSGDIHWVEFVLLALIVLLIGLGVFMAQRGDQPSYRALKPMPGEIMLGAPANPLTLVTPEGLTPDYMSIRFSQERVAMDFYNEAVSLGEEVCLSRLTRDTGNQFWLRSC